MLSLMALIFSLTRLLGMLRGIPVRVFSCQMTSNSRRALSEMSVTISLR